MYHNEIFNYILMCTKPEVSLHPDIVFQWLNPLYHYDRHINTISLDHVLSQEELDLPYP